MSKSSKKPFKETKLGSFLLKKAPKLMLNIGKSVFPPLDILDGLISNNEELSTEDKNTALTLTHTEYLHELEYHLQNTADARDMYPYSKDIVDDISNKIVVYNKPYNILLLVLNIACILLIENSAIIAIISNALGQASGQANNEINLVLNYYLGSAVKKLYKK